MHRRCIMLHLILLFLLWVALCGTYGMAESRAAKQARVGRLRRELPHISQSALIAILKEAQREPLPNVIRRDEIRLARDEIANTETPYGKVHQQIPLVTKNGTIWLLCAQAPWAMLYVAAGRSLALARLIHATIQRHGQPSPARPWRLVTYTDEVDPSDSIAGEHSRKFQALYWSILDFGVAALSHEETWFTAFCGRSPRFNNVAGGISAGLGSFLKLAFCGVHDPKLAGVYLHLAGGLGSVRLFFEMDMNTGDGERSSENIRLNCYVGGDWRRSALSA